MASVVGFPTRDLVEELTRRQGVAEHTIGSPEHVYRIQVMDTHGDKPEWWTIGPMTGPARILVVTD